MVLGSLPTFRPWLSRPSRQQRHHHRRLPGHAGRATISGSLSERHHFRRRRLQPNVLVDLQKRRVRALQRPAIDAVPRLLRQHDRLLQWRSLGLSCSRSSVCHAAIADYVGLGPCLISSTKRKSLTSVNFLSPNEVLWNHTVASFEQSLLAFRCRLSVTLCRISTVRRGIVTLLVEKTLCDTSSCPFSRTDGGTSKLSPFSQYNTQSSYPLVLVM